MVYNFIGAITTATHGIITWTNDLSHHDLLLQSINTTKHQKHTQKLIYLITELSIIIKIIETVVFLEYLRF